MDDPKLDEKVVDYYSGQRLSANSLEMILEETRKAREGFQARRTAESVDELQPARIEPDNAGVPVQGHSDKRSSINNPPTRHRSMPALSSAGAKSYSRGVDKRYSYRKIAASVCVLSVGAWLIAPSALNLRSADHNPVSQNQADQNSLSQIMMREAALNHQTKLQVEYDHSDLLALTKSMTRLEFDLVLPEKFSKGHTVLGGRYCTLGGNLAVHLRLQPLLGNPSGDVTAGEQSGGENENRSVEHERSVFMTLATDELLALSELNHVFPDDVSVNSWQQGELFYLLAEGGQQR